MHSIVRTVLFTLTLSPAILAPGQSKHKTAPTAAREFDDCSGAAWCPKMVVIPAGTFIMGSPKDEPGSYDIERPQQSVTIRRFAAGKFDVTRGQWIAFVEATHRPTVTGCQYSSIPKGEKIDFSNMRPLAQGSWKQLSFDQDDTHPVVCVTWKDAHDYLDWLSKRTGHKYRLLSESEWEYAARAGTTTAYPWGAKADHEHLNYGGEDQAGYGVAHGRDKWESTSPVGSFPPNAFGLYDMHGNVLQWVEDCFAISYADLPADGLPYLSDVWLREITGDLSSMNGKSSCSYRMVRGGDYDDPPPMVRSASRNWAPGWPPYTTLEDYSSSGMGIRVARDIQ